MRVTCALLSLPRPSRISGSLSRADSCPLLILLGFLEKQLLSLAFQALHLYVVFAEAMLSSRLGEA